MQPCTIPQIGDSVFRTELTGDLEHAEHEIPAVTHNNDKLFKLISDLPLLRRNHPDQIAVRLLAIDNPGYFFALQSWPNAMSAGALAHVPVEDIQVYASSYGDIQIYTTLQQQAMTAGDQAHACFLANPGPKPSELQEGTERFFYFSALSRLWSMLESRCSSALIMRCDCEESKNSRTSNPVRQHVRMPSAVASLGLSLETIRSQLGYPGKISRRSIYLRDGKHFKGDLVGTQIAEAFAVLVFQLYRDPIPYGHHPHLVPVDRLSFLDRPSNNRESASRGLHGTRKGSFLLYTVRVR